MFDKIKNWAYNYAHAFYLVGWVATISVTAFLIWSK